MGERLWLQTCTGAVRAGSVAALDVHHHPPLPERGTGYDTAANPADHEWLIEARLVGDALDTNSVLVACGDGIVAVDQVLALTRELAAHHHDTGLIAVQTASQDTTDSTGHPARLDIVTGIGFTPWAPTAPKKTSTTGN